MQCEARPIPPVADASNALGSVRWAEQFDNSTFAYGFAVAPPLRGIRRSSAEGRGKEGVSPKTVPFMSLANDARHSLLGSVMVRQPRLLLQGGWFHRIKRGRQSR